jgi:hypothetical protein
MSYFKQHNSLLEKTCLCLVSHHDIMQVCEPTGEIAMKTETQLQTIATAYKEICEGEEPWIALGNFMNDFFGNFPERREELLQEPPEEPVDPTPEQHHWAAFCAASAEYLSVKYGLSCPTWVYNPTYILLDPWFHSPAALQKPEVRERIMQEAPEPFARRNIYCSNRVFANKYERPGRQPA